MLNVNGMVDFWLRDVVSFRMVLDHRLVLIVVRTLVVGLVRGHLVAEETRGAVNGKIIGNGRGSTVVRTSLSIHVVLSLVDLGTAVRSNLGVFGNGRLRVHIVWGNCGSITVVRVGHDMRKRSIWVMIVAVRGRLPRSRGVSVIRVVNTMICIWVGNVGAGIVRTLNDATVPRGLQIVVRVLLLKAPEKGALVLVSGLSLHWCHDSGAIALSRVQVLVVVGLHLEDQVSIRDVRLTGAEGR